MEKAKRYLKDVSVVILILAAFSLVRGILDIILTDFSGAELPEGTTAGLILATRIVLIVIGFVILLPQIYVGVKGIQASKTSKISKAPVVWAIILAAFAVLGIASSVSELLKPGDLVGDLLSLADITVDALLFVMYVKYAKQLKTA